MLVYVEPGASALITLAEELGAMELTLLSHSDWGHKSFLQRPV